MENRERSVLAVGGGLPVREENRRYLRRFGEVVYLRATPETIYERVKEDTTRPLLKGDDMLGKITGMQAERDKYYSLAADIVVDTDGKTPDRIADEIIERLEL